MVRAGWRPQDAALVLAFVLYALVAAAFLALNMPPYQNPDETTHLLRADNISRGHLIGHRFGEGDAGGIAAPEIDRSGKPFDAAKAHPETKVTMSLYLRAYEIFGEPGQDISFSNTAVYPPFFYAPSVVALWIGKAGRMNVLQTLYLARLLTALVSCALIAAALLVCVGAGAGGAATMIFAVATLPMALSVQSAISQDGPMLGTAALAAALFARLRMAPREGGFGLMCVCLALIAMARPPYAFLALVPLAAPIGWRARVRGAAGVVLACGAWTLLATSTASTEMTSRGVDVAAQLRVMLDPAKDLAVLIETFHVGGWIYVTHLVGQLGWLDVTLPGWLVKAALAVLGLAALAGLDLRGRGVGGVLLGVLLSSVCVLALLYLTWNPVGGPRVDGVQGRYFLPLLIMLAGLGTTLARLPVGPAASLVVMGFPVVSLGMTMRAVVLRYYLAP